MRNRDSLEYIIPEDMKLYLSNYGRHFNKKMYEFAVSNMYRSGGQKVSTIGKTIFDNGHGWTDKYIDVWTEILTIVDTDFENQILTKVIKCAIIKAQKGKVASMEIKKYTVGEDEFEFVCEYWETSRAWGHRVTLFMNGVEITGYSMEILKFNFYLTPYRKL